MNESFGIDIGGSGIKAARVDMNTGEFIGERIKVATPQPATPEAIGQVVADIVAEVQWDGPVGITLPSVIQNQQVLSAANIDKRWVGIDAQEHFGAFLGSRELAVLNDADAAGLAEVAYGDPRASYGSALFLTLGTGIGSAFLTGGRLFPNTELGHLMVGKKEAEHIASSAAKERDGLKHSQWAKQLSKVLEVYESLFNPEVFIIGGGISRKYDKWGPHVSVDTPIIPAQLRNQAGIVGAAMAARDAIRP